jgi:hypothetical protein
MKLVYKIGNSEELNPSQAILLIEVGETHCCFGIVDYANFMMVECCYYISEKSDNIDILKKMIERHEELKQTFRQTVIGYYTHENIMIPSKYFKYEDTQKLLQAMYDRGQYVTVSESVAEWQLYNVYHVPVTTHGLISRHFATGNFWHVHSILLKNGIEQDDAGNLFIDFKTDSFTVMAIKNNTLLLSQIYSYLTAKDVLYWVLKICKEYLLLQDEVKVMLSGLVDKQSAVFKELNQYFIHIGFANIENDIQLSRDFEEYPIHFFSSLYKLASCVS